MIAPYIVTGENRAGTAVSCAVATAAGALAKAKDLLESGVTKVRIIDAEGQVYAPSEFNDLAKLK